jgi:hypothetical protein
MMDSDILLVSIDYSSVYISWGLMNVFMTAYADYLWVVHKLVGIG